MATTPPEISPDPLTPRQEDILRLLDAGRTDEEIAYELILTVDGVEQHMSRVIAQLGASNREEAVTIWREQHRGERSKTTRRLASVALLIAITAVAGILLLKSNDGQTEAPAQAEPSPGASSTSVPAIAPPPLLSPEELLEKMEAAVLDGGQIFHVYSTARGDDLEAWFDFAGGRLRVEHREAVIPRQSTNLREFSAPRSWRTLIINGDTLATDTVHTSDPDSPVIGNCLDDRWSRLIGMLSCGLGAGPSLPPSPITLTVEIGVFEEAPAYVLVAESTPFEGLGTQSMTLYVDVFSLLPLGYESDWQAQYGGAYVWEFIPLTDVSPVFFLPVSLGYPEGEVRTAEMLATVATAGPVYWFGNTINLGAGFPDLALSRVFPRRAALEPPSVLINYGLSERGVALTYLERWSVDDWRSHSEVYFNFFMQQECVDEEVIQLDDRSVRILKNLSGPGTTVGSNPNAPPSCGTGACATPGPDSEVGTCESDRHNRFMAVVTFEDAVVVINGDLCIDGLNFCRGLLIEPSLNTRDAVLAMAIALTRYPAGDLN